MGIFNKSNAIELTQEDLQDAKSTAGIFVDEFVKRRAFANVIAARSALKLLFSLNIDATNLYSMYSINKVLEKLDIADVYAGNVRIDARLVSDSDEIFIPKSHFNLGIVPDLYVVFKLDKSLSSVEFLGCINPEEIDKTKENRDYYFVNEDVLYNLKIFKNLVRDNKTSLSYVPSEEEIERAENLIIPLEDGDIFNADYEFLIKQLAFNIDLRKKSVEFENFEFVSKKVVTDETVYGDSVLGLIGSEKLYDRNEFTTDIDLNELSDETVDSFVDDFDESDYIVPQMDEYTGEISLDDALNQMDGFDNNSEIIEDEDFDSESKDNLNDDENLYNENNLNNVSLDDFIEEMSDFENSQDDSYALPEHKLSDDINIDNSPSTGVYSDAETDLSNQGSEEDFMSFDSNNDILVDNNDESSMIEVSADEIKDDALQDNIDIDYSDMSELNDNSLSSADEALSANSYADENVDSDTNENVVKDNIGDYSNVNDDDFSEIQNYQENSSAEDSEYSEDLVSLPELDIDEEDDEDLNFDPDAPINFDIDGDIGGFDLPDLEGFSMDDAVNELESSSIDESLAETKNFENSVESNNTNDDISVEDMVEPENNSHSEMIQAQIPLQSQVSTKNSDIKPFDDDEDIADLPVLKIVNENADTYKKKIYNTPKIDDIDMENVNLDDFDDYDAEDKEESEKQSKELDEMMSDLDNILNSENLSLDGVDDILTDEELNESLKKIEEEENLKKQQEEENLRAKQSLEQQNQIEYSDTSAEDSVENDENVSDNQNDTESSSMSLDDFLNSSSFNDMSTNNENGANIENNQNLNDIYQDESILSQQPIGEDNPEILLTDEATMVDNSANLYDEHVTDTESAKAKPKSRAPQLAVVLVILMCACVYVNKDIIMDNFNISFPKKAEEPVPEFDLNSLKEPQPVSGEDPAQNQIAEESPIPSIPQPTDMPDTPPVPSSEQVPDSPVASADSSQSVPAAVPQNTSNKITKLSWEVPEHLANNDKIRKYLQIAGRTLKLSLQNDLLVATELPFSNKIMLDLKIVPSGNIVSSDFIISSGSKQIDNIVLQSVKDTLKYVRPPLGEIQSPNSNFTLIINF